MKVKQRWSQRNKRGGGMEDDENRLSLSGVSRASTCLLLQMFPAESRKLSSGCCFDGTMWEIWQQTREPAALYAGTSCLFIHAGSARMFLCFPSSAEKLVPLNAEMVADPERQRR